MATQAPSQAPTTATQAFVTAHAGQRPPTGQQSQTRVAQSASVAHQTTTATQSTTGPGAAGGEQPTIQNAGQVDELETLRQQLKKLQDKAETASVDDALAKVMEMAHTQPIPQPWESYTAGNRPPRRTDYTWVTLEGAPGQDQHLPDVRTVAAGLQKASPRLLSFRNPNEFVAGEIHKTPDGMVRHSHVRK
ncbi:uncharacterized protein [Ptychodera flava]|uniref:uncharacterized protein n=1 Tax=Ptychodera flava TaxID=63121 RepID=UPI00396AB11B